MSGISSASYTEAPQTLITSMQVLIHHMHTLHQSFVDFQAYLNTPTWNHLLCAPVHDHTSTHFSWNDRMPSHLCHHLHSQGGKLGSTLNSVITRERSAARAIPPTVTGTVQGTQLSHLRHTFVVSSSLSAVGRLGSYTASHHSL